MSASWQPPDDEPDWRLRLHRARWLAERVSAAHHDWAKQQSIESAFRGERRERWALTARLDSQPVLLALLFGEVLHGLRTALDNLVYAHAVANNPGGLTPEQEKSCEFPIFTSSMSAHTRRRKIGLLSQAAQDFIVGCQPYNSAPKHGDGTVDGHPLAQLHFFNNIDKHRRLPVVAAAMSVERIVVKGVSSWRFSQALHDAPVTDGQVLLEIAFSDDDLQNLSVGHEAAICAAIGEGAQYGVNVDTVLQTIFNWVSVEVAEPLGALLPT